MYTLELGYCPSDEGKEGNTVFSRERMKEYSITAYTLTYQELAILDTINTKATVPYLFDGSNSTPGLPQAHVHVCTCTVVFTS